MPKATIAAAAATSMSATASLASRSTASAASASASATSSGGGGSRESPYLYFIALGLGIVFTNLWIILGIRYCCRRNRLAEGTFDDEADHDQFYSNIATHRGIYLAMTGIDESGRVRERRRKKQKTLMRIEELDERFPVQKYKQWIAAEGDCFGGGISVEAAQVAAQKRDEATVEGTNSDQAGKDATRTTAATVDSAKLSMEKQIPSVTVQSDFGSVDTSGNDMKPISSSGNINSLQVADQNPNNTKTPRHSVDITQQMIDLDVHEDAAYGLEIANDTNADGDVCAICLENLQPEDDIRALSCKHVFHDECIRLWFTSRKASCPLCKHDYYTGPRQSNEPTETAQENDNGENSAAVDEENRPPNNQDGLGRVFGFVSRALTIPGGTTSRP